MSVKKKCPEFENHERWLVSYADMVTLLFAVFVVLYALSIAGKEEESKQVAGSMQESFNTPLEDIPIDRRVGPSEQGFGIFEHFKGNTTRPPLTKKFPSSSQRTKIIDEEMKRVEMLLEDRLYGPNKFRELQKPGEQRIVSVHRDEKGFRIRLLARHFFDPGSVEVKRQALPELDQIVGILKELSLPVRIEGHTDSIPPQGEMTNWEISALRATNVLKYMTRKHQFPPMLLTPAGYADTRPIAHNGSESGRSLNRRVEFYVEYDEQSPSSTGD